MELGLTVETLRAELDRFAKGALRLQFEDFKGSILQNEGFVQNLQSGCHSKESVSNSAAVDLGIEAHPVEDKRLSNWSKLRGASEATIQFGKTVKSGLDDAQSADTTPLNKRRMSLSTDLLSQKTGICPGPISPPSTLQFRHRTKTSQTIDSKDAKELKINADQRLLSNPRWTCDEVERDWAQQPETDKKLRATAHVEEPVGASAVCTLTSVPSACPASTLSDDSAITTGTGAEELPTPQQKRRNSLGAAIETICETLPHTVVEEFNIRSSEVSDTPGATSRVSQLPSDFREIGDVRKNVPLMVLYSRGLYIIRSCVVVVNMYVVWVTTDLRLQIAIQDYLDKIHSQPTDNDIAERSVMERRRSLYFGIEIACFVFFICELCFRAFAEKRQFVFASHFKWNMFDVCVVLASLPHFLRLCVSGHSIINFSFFRFMRLVSFVHLARSRRLQKFTSSMRLVLSIISKSLPSLVSTVVALGLVVSIWTMWICSLITIALPSTHEDLRATELLIHFKNCKEVFITLLKAVSGGDDWGNIMDPLEQINFSLRYVFILYLCFMIIGVLNIVTGVFVEHSMQLASDSREIMIKSLQEKEDLYVKELQQIFTKADADHSGTLTWDEFEKHLDDDRVIAYLSSLDLDPQEVQALFRLLDIDGNNEVKIEDIGWGCLRLKGQARSLDLCTLLYEHRQHCEKVATFFQVVGNQLDELREVDSRMPKDAEVPALQHTLSLE